MGWHMTDPWSKREKIQKTKDLYKKLEICKREGKKQIIVKLAEQNRETIIYCCRDASLGFFILV